jgi:hypothetical protein
MRSCFDSSDRRAKSLEDAMRNGFKPSGKLTVTALLASLLALPTAATPQTTSNASLADTITWLTSFLPTATDGRSDILQETTTLVSFNGCSIVLHHSVVMFNAGRQNIDYFDDTTDSFSLSDIDPSTIKTDTNGGVYRVWLFTKGGSLLVQETGGYDNRLSHVAYSGAANFNDQASAQRVVNAFQHAAQLCANSQPF